MLHCWRVTGQDVFKGVRIKSYVAVDPRIPVSDKQAVEEKWSEIFRSPRFVVESSERVESDIELDLVIQESDDPAQRVTLRELVDSVEVDGFGTFLVCSEDLV